MAGPATVLVVAAGDPDELGPVPSADLVVAADSGLDLALARGLDVDVVVGDMDSVDPASLAAAAERGVRVHRHPREKDETDLELALALALAAAPTRIHVVVGAAGRLDHAVANLAVLASPRWASVEVDATVGKARVWVVRAMRPLPLAIGDPVGLIPVGGPATGVSTEGLAYPLAGETLDPFAARAIANEVVAVPVRVGVEGGVLLAISGPTPPIGPGGAPGRG